MMNRVAPPPFQRPQAQPKFGNIATMGPAILKAVDYASLGTSTVGQNMGIYGTVIASRLWKSRSPNEFWENARRDVLGWYNWFMGSPIIQTLLVGGLAAIPGKYGKDATRLMLTPLHKDMSFPEKAIKFLFSPNQVNLIASDAQLHQHQGHIMTSLEKLGQKAQAGKVAELFGAARRSRAMISAVGLAYTFFALGIGIIWLNIILTKMSLKKSQGSQGQKAPMANRFQGQTPISPAQQALWAQYQAMAASKSH